MIVRYHSNFKKNLRSFSHAKIESIRETILFFQEHPHHPSLRTHALKDELVGYWSFSIDDNLRVLFSQKDNFQEILLVKVGNHETVYKTPIF